MSLANKVTSISRTPIENPVTIDDIVSEGTIAGEILRISPFSKGQLIGILASVKKLVGQTQTTISVNGVGSYGLTKKNLENIGVLKKNIGLSDNAANLETILSDSSVFTGKEDIYKINDLLNNKILQQKLIQNVILKLFNKLKQEGLLIGDETDEEASVLAGLIGYTVNQIKDWINGTSDETLSAQIDVTARSSLYAIRLVNEKAASTLNKIQGLGKNATGSVSYSTNTIETTTIDTELVKFLGSKRLESSVITTTTNTSKSSGAISKEDLF